MQDTAFLNIIDSNFLPHARVLFESLKEHHPDVPFYLLVVDDDSRGATPPDFPGIRLTLADCGLTGTELLYRRFSYTLFEMICMAKAYALKAVLGKGHRTVLYIDGDIRVYNDLSDLIRLVSQHPVTLTPHLLEPLEGPDRVEREAEILLAGVFNAGFLGVSDKPQGHAFLEWWLDRISRDCRHNPGKGLFYEQRWLNYAPAYVPDLGYVRDPGCNVAHWNLPERPLSFSDGRLHAAGVPCRFFHFSGFNPDKPECLSKYTHRPTGKVEVEICQDYAVRLKKAGHGKLPHNPYPFAAFANGVPIPHVARVLHDRLGDEAKSFGDPFRTDEGSFYQWLRMPAARGVTNLWKQVIELRPDLAAAFPDPLGAGRKKFIAWIERHGRTAYAVPQGDF